MPLSVNGDGEATTTGVYLANLHRRPELWFKAGEHQFEKAWEAE